MLLADDPKHHTYVGRGSDDFINTPLVFVNESSGLLQVTATRLGSDPSVDAVGQQVLITLRFSRVSVGSDVIDFNLSGAINAVIQDEFGNNRPADFGPGHGGVVTVP